MPNPQSAQVANYEFGAPVALGVVAKWNCLRGGKVLFTFTDEGDADAVASIEVSADDVTYAATTAALNNTAVTSLSIPRKVCKTVEVLLRAGVDKFVQLKLSGGTRVTVQLREHERAGVQDMTF